MKYDRIRAVDYARRFAFCETDHDYRSGTDADATAFVARCIGAGLSTPLEYTDSEALFHALTARGIGEVCGRAALEAGDIVQLRAPGLPPRSLFVTGRQNGELLVAAHSYAACDRPLSSYGTMETVYLKIRG